MTQHQGQGLIVDLFAGGGGASRRGHVTPAGRARQRQAVTKHGESYSPEYKAWQTMRLRCTDPTNQAYPDYGGRGITVCDRWLGSVDAFIADMGRKPTPRHELDRIENDKGYEPENCRWTTRTVNCRNRRSNRLITLGAETHTLAEWCELRRLPRDTVWKRLAAGWSDEVALSTPVMRRGPQPRGSRV